MGVLAPASGVPETQAVRPRESQSAFLQRMAFRLGIAAVLIGAEAPHTEAGEAPRINTEHAVAPAGLKEHMRAKYGDVQARVAQLVSQIERVRTFQEREDITEELEALQEETYFLFPFGGFRAGEYLQKHHKELTPEQCMRLRSLACRFDPHEVPFTVPQVSGSFDSIFADISECVNHELRLDVTGETRERLKGKTVTVPEGGEGMWEVVKRLGETGDLKIVLSRNGIALTDAPNAPEVTMLATDGKAALFLHPSTVGQTQNVSLAFEPGSGGHFLHAEEAYVSTGPVNRLVIAPPQGLQQLIDVHKRTYEAAPDTRTDAWNRCLNWYDPVTRVSVTPTRTYLPVTARMPFEDLTVTQCGMQMVGIKSIERKDGMATVTVTVDSWRDKPWCKTPYEEDRSRYLWGAGAAIRFLDENGTELSAKEGAPSMNTETLTRTFTVPDTAKSVEVVTHETIGRGKQHFFSFPSEHIREEYVGEQGMPPLLRKDKEPAQADAEDEND